MVNQWFWEFELEKSKVFWIILGNWAINLNWVFLSGFWDFLDNFFIGSGLSKISSVDFDVIDWNSGSVGNHPI